MKTTQALRYAVRLNYGQVNDIAGKSTDRNTTRSAALLAALGIGLSSFSMKQMLAKSGKKKPLNTSGWIIQHIFPTFNDHTKHSARCLNASSNEWLLDLCCAGVCFVDLSDKKSSGCIRVVASLTSW
uniref:Uncharacterized protein n=1 Tax=Anopheles marajoara TaxID=58244 RepID=A0A2M4C3E9_9DIPT